MGRPIGYYLSDGLKCDTSLNGGAGGKRLHNLSPYILKDRNGGPRDRTHIKRHEYRAEFPMARSVPQALWSDIVTSAGDLLERVVEVEFDDTNFDEWRIRSVEEVVDRGTEVAMLETVAPVMDLDTSGLIARVEADGTARISFPVGMKTPDELVDLILGNLSPYVSGPPAYFAKGTVDPTARVQVFNFDGDTAWTALTELEKLVYPHELAWTRNGTTGYVIHLLTQIGATSNEVPLRVSRNVFSLRHESSTRKQVTRVVPRGRFREDGERMSMATNLFDISSVLGSTLTMADSIVGEDDQWNGFFIRKPDASLTQITDSTAPDQITVADATGLAGGNGVSIRLNASGDELIYVPSPSAEAVYQVKAKTLIRDDIPAIDNEIPNASLISWSGGLPVGAQTVGSPTVQQNTDERFASWGGTSAHVTADTEGEGLGWAFPVFPTDRFPHYTPQIRLYVVSGRAELLLVDSTNATVYPLPESQQRADTSRLGWIDLGMAHGENHFEHGTQDMELRVVSADGAAEFYIDIVMVTNTVDGVPAFYDGRASNQLLIAALDELAIRSLPLSNYSVVAYDLNRTDATIWPDEPFDPGAGARLVADRLPFEAITRIIGVERFLENETRSTVELETEEDRLTREVTERRQADIRNPVPPHAQKPGCPLNAQAVLGIDLEITWTPALSSLTDWRIAGVGATAIEEWENGQPLDVVDGSNLVITAPRHTLLSIPRVVGRSLNRWGVYSDCAVAVDVQQTAVSPCANIAPPDGAQEWCSPDSVGDLVYHQYIDVLPRTHGLVDLDPAVYKYKAKVTDTSVGGGTPTITDYDMIAHCTVTGGAARAGFRHSVNTGGLNFDNPQAGPFTYNAWWKAAISVTPGGSSNAVKYRLSDLPGNQMVPRGSSGTDTDHFGDAGVAALIGRWGPSYNLGGFGFGGLGGEGAASKPAKFRALRVCTADTIAISNLLSGAGIIFFRELGLKGGDEHGAATFSQQFADGAGNIAYDTEGWCPYDGFIVADGTPGSPYTVRPSGGCYPGDQYFWDQGLNIATKVASGLIYERVLFQTIDIGSTLIDAGGTPSVNVSGELELNQDDRVMVAMTSRSEMYVQCEVFREDSTATNAEVCAVATGIGVATSDLGSTVSIAILDSGGSVQATKTPAPTTSVTYTDSACVQIPPIQPNHDAWRFFAERKSVVTQGIACAKELQVNPGRVCCLYQNPSPDIPAVDVDCLISAALTVESVSACGGAGVKLRVDWTVDPNGPCLNLDTQWIMEFLFFEEHDPTNFPGDFGPQFVRRDPGPVPTTGTYTTFIYDEDPNNFGPGNGRGTDGITPVIKQWKVRVILRDKFLGNAAGSLDATASSPVAYDWCP